MAQPAGSLEGLSPLLSCWAAPLPGTRPLRKRFRFRGVRLAGGRLAAGSQPCPAQLVSSSCGPAAVAPPPALSRAGGCSAALRSRPPASAGPPPGRPPCLSAPPPPPPGPSSPWEQGRPRWGSIGGGEPGDPCWVRSSLSPLPGGWAGRAGRVPGVGHWGQRLRGVRRDEEDPAPPAPEWQAK